MLRRLPADGPDLLSPFNEHPLAVGAASPVRAFLLTDGDGGCGVSSHVAIAYFAIAKRCATTNSGTVKFGANAIGNSNTSDESGLV